MRRGDPNRNTQCDRFLGLLIKARGGRVSLPAILALGIAQYNARVHELRRMGFAIVNERERVNGQLRTWFRLISGPPPSSDQEFQQQKSQTGGAPDGNSETTLFGNISPMRYPD
jgi:hypothetical protein